MTTDERLAEAVRLLTDASPGAHLIFRGKASCDEWWKDRERLLLELRNKSQLLVDCDMSQV